jgi:PAS domain S-box-containing protein
LGLKSESKKISRNVFRFDKGDFMEANKKSFLKELIRRIQSGENFEDLKRDFSKTLGASNPVELSLIEDEFLSEGASQEDFQKLREINLVIFRDSIQNQKPKVSKGHPIYTLMAEHALLMEYINELVLITSSLVKGHREARPAYLERVRQLIQYFIESESHYLREENALFPVIEKHGLTGPPSAMWTEHQEIHSMEKELFELNSDTDKALTENIEKINEVTNALANMLASHFNKENSVLFPASLRMFKEEEWDIVAQDFNDIGYCSYSIKATQKGVVAETEKASVSDTDEIVFGSGRLSVDKLEAIFNHLPIDMTFVDAQDRVQFFSESPDRIFVRSRAVIGRSVQLCHPKKSVHVVEEILNDFRSGKRDSAEFWINLGGKTIHIRYFAVRDAEGKYLGCLEVSQDITEILKISGEKRLLD